VPRAAAARRPGSAVELSSLAAGFHAVAHLPSPVDEQAVVAAARDRSVGLYGMSAYRSTGATAPPQLVLGFGNLGERAIRASRPSATSSRHAPRRAVRSGLRWPSGAGGPGRADWPLPEQLE
jgi:hypothetical protein